MEEKNYRRLADLAMQALKHVTDVDDEEAFEDLLHTIATEFPQEVEESFQKWKEKQ